MATSKFKRPTYTTPKGSFKFPSLTKPDFGNEKFPKPDGEFKTRVVMSAADAQPLIDKLTPEWNEAIATGRAEFAALPMANRKKLGSLKEQPFFEEEFDPQTEEATGNVIFNFKCKYKITDKKTKEVRFNKIGLFDSQGKPLPAGTAIYGGTIGKIAFQANPYFVAGAGMAGLSLRLTAAQVIELVGPGNRSASSFGFGAEEGGYEAGEVGEEDTPPFSTDAKSAADGDQTEF